MLFRFNDFLSRKLYKSILALVLISFPLKAQYYEYTHPELEWKSFDTEHFTVHFHQGTKRTAFAAAKIIEDIYPAVTGLYDYHPKDRIHLIIKDTDDYSNGGAYFFNNKMEIWATNLDYVMRGTKNWLRDVLTHEFTHMVSIQKTIKTSLTFPYGFFQWFGYEPERRKDVVRGFPNILVSYPISSINMPVWFAEGVAQYQNNQARFDYRDPHREMVIRDRLLSEQFLTYNEMSVFGKTSHGNESSYNLGFSFTKYLAGRFGEKILSKITELSSHWTSYTFSGVLEEATGVPTDTLYKDWKDSLTQIYLKRTDLIRKNTVKGDPIESQGFGNLHPIYSPDGKYIAYVSNAGEDYFFMNRLELYNRQTKEKKALVGGIASSISWSPDGRYIAYAAKEYNEHKSQLDDLFLYDLEKEETIQLTHGLRGSNPDFSNDGKKLAFVTSTNGLHQLNIYYLPDDVRTEKYEQVAFDMETGVFSTSFSDPKTQRPVKIKAGKIEQLQVFPNGRQIYHPRWSNDDKKIVFGTAVEYGRNIGVFDLEKNEFSIMMKAEEELRYPAFDKKSDWLYYSASTSGIYNLYRKNLKTGEVELLTNVSGGAFMPAIDKNGSIVYACYDSVGYKIYELKNPKPLDPALAIYDENYIATIPDKNFDDSDIPDYKVRNYKETFSKAMILPRLFVDYKTIKPGIYVISSDIMNQLNLIVGAAVNSDLDYDLYGYVSHNKFGPTLFAEAFNVSANIQDTVVVPRGDVEARGVRDVNFDLLQFSLGIGFNPVENMEVTLGYLRSLYSAKLDPVYLSTPLEKFQIPTIRYDYLKGHSFQAKMSLDAIKIDRFRDVNPSGGFYLFAKYGYENNDFLQGFSTDKQLGLEDFKTYKFHMIEISGEYYMQNPLFDNHALGIHFKGGYIDRKVDDFFNFFAGGIIGLKGYPFYSIEGRQKMIGGLTYRFPIHRNLDWKLGHIQFDKLYMGLFYDYGNAFDGDKINFASFKRDLGLELRLDSFSYNMFPTRVFFQAAWPIDKIHYNEVVYPREWRYYFGVLFDFDLRERMGSLIKNNSALGSLKFW